MLENLARRQPFDGGGDRPRVVGRRPAAAADDVDEAALGELPQQRARRLRALLVVAEGVRKARVRMHARVAVGEARELLHVLADLLRPQRAVDADDEWIRVLDRGPERLQRLARERAAGEVDDRDRDPEGQVDAFLVQHVATRGDGGLRVQRVEDRLDEEEVDAAVDEAAHLLRIALAHVIEGDCAVGGVVDLGRERERLVQRPERAGDEAAPIRVLVASLPREPGALEVQVVDDVLEAVVRLPDRRGRERVRRRDVRARPEVGAVDVEDDLGTGEVEEVGIAGDLAGMVAEALAAVVRVLEPFPLQHRPPRAVEHENPLREQVAQGRGRGLDGRRHGSIVPRAARRARLSARIAPHGRVFRRYARSGGRPAAGPSGSSSPAMSDRGA